MMSPAAMGDIGDDRGPNAEDPIAMNQDSTKKCPAVRPDMISNASVLAMITRIVLKIRTVLRTTGFTLMKTRTAPKKIQIVAALNATVLQPGQTLLRGVNP
jgi:hypothetical protein